MVPEIAVKMRMRMVVMMEVVKVMVGSEIEVVVVALMVALEVDMVGMVGWWQR